MFSKKYRLSYLPLFYEDLDEKVMKINKEPKTTETQKITEETARGVS